LEEDNELDNQLEDLEGEEDIKEDL